MSLCGLESKMATRAGLGAAVAGLILYQLDDLRAVSELHAAAPLHFVQGLLLGSGLALMIGGLLRRRREG